VINLELVVALTGASGVIYGVHLLKVLRHLKISTHLIISDPAKVIIKHELKLNVKEIEKFADFVYTPSDLTAPIASGSYQVSGMVIVPCSMKTLAAIASGYADNLIVRVADCMLKEKRPLILVPRETPLSIIHLRNMVKAAEAGAIIIPAMPGFYHEPKTIEDLVNFVVGKILDVLGIQHDLYRRWRGK
jgi:4-hydroxy-3-polyprenylbenzoate decarboxylase